MSKKAAFITIHGMGTTEPNYNKDIVKEIKDRLGTKFDDLHVGKVYYQDILQDNENRVWELVANKVKWDGLRKFMLFGFADAAGLENGKEANDSVYSQAQLRIAKELLIARKAMNGDGPVVIIAQSLGTQVVSCYFWDAVISANTPNKVKVGIWQDGNNFGKNINNGQDLTNDEINFIRGNSLHTLFTTGCNIPMFVAAHATDKIEPIKPNNFFKWENYYDKDDVLGWPLSDLSDNYKSTVKDHQINAGGGVIGWLVKSWNPWSHGQYWGDNDVLDPLEEILRLLV
jgi:hypothetical protein